jgi:hypothetical protein
VATNFFRKPVGGSEGKTRMLDQEVYNKDRVPMDESFIVASAEEKVPLRKNPVPLLNTEFLNQSRGEPATQCAR